MNFKERNQRLMPLLTMSKLWKIDPSDYQIYQCHKNKKTNQAAADLKEKLTKEKTTADKIKKTVETFTDENYFTNPVLYCIMVNKHEAKGLYPNIMSLLELCDIIPSSMTKVERGFSGGEITLYMLGSKYAAQYTRYFNANLSVWRLAYLWGSCRYIPR